MCFLLPDDEMADDDREEKAPFNGDPQSAQGQSMHFGDMLFGDDEWTPFDEPAGAMPYGTSGLTPEEEREWMQALDDFENQLENAVRIPLRDFMRNPTLRDPSELSGHELIGELVRVLDLMAAQGVFLEIQGEVGDAELYRFIVEELFDEEVEDVHIDGFNMHFIYEEFHPNDELDVRCWSIEFLTALFDHDLAALRVVCSEDELYNAQGQQVDVATFEASIRSFWRRNPKILDYFVEVAKVRVDGDVAVVDVMTEWQALKRRPVDLVTTSGRGVVHLKRSNCYGWDVTRAMLPGWLEVL